MGKVVVIGSSNTDLVITSSHLPLAGETVMGNEFSVFAGGKGANQAVAAARAGGDVLFVAKVGHDNFGLKAIEGYKKDRIVTDKIGVDTELPSGIAVILVDESTGQNSIVVASGSNSNLSIDDIKRAEKEIKEADVVLVQLEIPLDVVEFSLRMAKDNGVKTILNPAPARHLSNELLSLVDIITPNETETQLLVGIDPNVEIKKATARLLSKINDTVIITLGSEGVYYASKNGDEGIIDSIKVDVTDTTAAGDVFNGYLAAMLADGMECKEAIILSNRAAAISVTRKGAQPSIPKIAELK